MSGKSQYLAAKLADLALSAAAWSSPATTYIALYTAGPAADGSGTEASGGSYARVAKTNNATNWPAATVAAPAVKSNGTVVTYPAPTGNWGTIVGFGVLDDPTAGHLLYWGPLNSPVTVSSGDPAPTFPAGTLVITEA